MQKIVFFVLFFALLVPGISEAQLWKQMRYEFAYGAGASNYLGELGGANQIGTNQFRDLEYTMTRSVFSVGLRYRMLQWLSVKGSLQLGMLSGDDKLTQDPSRNYRNLSFKSPIYEFAIQFETSLLKEKMGKTYKLRGAKGYKWLRYSFYPFAGIAGFYMNPKGEFNGIWYALQPLATEGQGTFSTRRKYSRFQVAIPVGFGFKYGLSKRMSISFEYGVRKTFTDYIDDVSTTYVHEEYIKGAASGYTQVALELADRADGDLGQEGSDPYKTAPGAQRGDPNDKDSYMFAILALNYRFRNFKRIRGDRPKF